jgi:hypothetical protein
MNESVVKRRIAGRRNSAAATPASCVVASLRTEMAASSDVVLIHRFTKCFPLPACGWRSTVLLMSVSH